MTKRTGAALLVLVLATGGCDKIRDKIPFLAKKKADTTKVAAAPAKAATPATTTQPVPAPTAKAPTAAPTKAPPPPPVAVKTAATEEPWTPKDTGTVSPGMTRDQVAAVWGKPETERSAGKWSYLYYRNGCEASCGTFDLVILDSGQVVDAVVRGHGHTYSGVSSSPADRTGKFTPPTKADSGRGGQ